MSERDDKPAEEVVMLVGGWGGVKCDMSMGSCPSVRGWHLTAGGPQKRKLDSCLLV